MKSIALLATALFLASAPAPDSDTISELSAGFLSQSNVQPLLAAEFTSPNQQVQAAISTPAESVVGEVVKKPLRQAIKNALLTD